MRCRRFRAWIVIWALAGSSPAYVLSPLAASSESAALPSNRLDSLVSSIALYPDPLLAKVLIAATYPLEVNQAARWLRLHNLATDSVLEPAIARQPWDDSVKDLVRVPAVLSMMDGRLQWTQILGDAFLSHPVEVIASVRRLRAMAQKAHTLHSTAHQKITDERNGIRIEPAVAKVIDVPFYDPRVAYGQWPHPTSPPMWWTAPSGYIYSSGIGFMASIAVPATFWKDTVDWNTGTLVADGAGGLNDHNRGTETPWIHDPEHRRFVSYSTPQLRLQYGRGFTPGAETRDSLRGYDVGQEPFAVERIVPSRGRTVPTREALHDTRSKARLSAFEDIGQGARERAFSRRGNASIVAARRDNVHFAIGEIAAAAAESSTVATR